MTSLWPASKGCGRGSQSRRHVEQHLRTACDLLFDHTMLLRGHSTRACQLPDLFTLEFESRLRAAGLALPAISGPDLGQQRTVALPEPLSGTLEPAEPPDYEMVRTHGTVTDL
jgi:hypothetical protein